MALNMTDR